VLTDIQAFHWRQRLREERAIRNITDTHIRVLEFTQGAIEAGRDDMSHAAVAEALTVAVRTVGEAYKRAAALGLLGWEAQYRTVQGVRRRTVNRYRLTMPAKTPEPRPDLKLKRKVHLIPRAYRSAESAEPGLPQLHVIAKAMEERVARRWAARWVKDGGR